MKRFIISDCFYIFTTFSDLIITYIVSPDLSMESNFLVKNLGLGWSALIVAAVVSIAIVVLFSYYNCFVYKTVYTECRTFTEYYSLICFGRPDRFWTGAFPKHISPELSALGFALPWVFGCFRFICVCEWTTIYYNIDSIFPFGILRVKGFAYVPALMMLIALYYYWFYSEFKKQKG